jgi:hypothetical protein
LAKGKTSATIKQAINEEHNEVIELVVKENKPLDVLKLKLLMIKK